MLVTRIAHLKPDVQPWTKVLFADAALIPCAYPAKVRSGSVARQKLPYPTFWFERRDSRRALSWSAR